MVFLHEYHHIIETNILEKNNTCKDFFNTYIITGNINYQKKLCTASVKNMSFNSRCYDFTKFKNKNDLILKKIKFALAGYAAEEAFKKQSFFFNYFNQKNCYNFFTKSFLLMAYKHFFCSFPVADIATALNYAKQIDYNDYKIKFYINEYKTKSQSCENKYLQNKIQNKLLYLSSDTLYLLSYLYENLIKKYSSQSHQKKIFDILEKNSDIASYEIFFLPDLIALWNKEKLPRDLAHIESFNDEEKKIIINLQNKILLSFEKIKQIRCKYNEKNNYIIKYIKKTQILKKNLYNFFKKNFKKGKSFFTFLKNILLEKIFF